MINNFLYKSEKNYNITNYLKYSVSVYCHLIFYILFFLKINLLLKNFLPLLLICLFGAIIELYYRFNDLNIFLIIVSLFLHLFPVILWFTLDYDLDYKLWVNSCIYTFIIGFIIFVIYYFTGCWPYFITPLQCILISFITFIVIALLLLFKTMYSI